LIKESMTSGNSKKATDNGSMGGPWSFLTAVVIVIGGIFLAYQNQQISNLGLERTDPRQELLLGYKMLGNNLENGSQMKDLILFRKGTFRAPSADLERLMSTVAQTASTFKTELKGLRKLEPTLLETPPKLKLLDTMEQLSVKAGKLDMLFPHGTFDMRFVGLQYLATQMISSIALSTSQLEPNKERKSWLEKVAKEFDEIREQLITSVETCHMS